LGFRDWSLPGVEEVLDVQDPLHVRETTLFRAMRLATERGGGRERERERKRESARARGGERDRASERERARERKREKKRDRQTDRQTDTKPEPGVGRTSVRETACERSSTAIFRIETSRDRVKFRQKTS
jgi:hypothetical protein